MGSGDAVVLGLSTGAEGASGCLASSSFVVLLDAAFDRAFSDTTGAGVRRLAERVLERVTGILVAKYRWHTCRNK